MCIFSLVLLLAVQVVSVLSAAVLPPKLLPPKIQCEILRKRYLRISEDKSKTTRLRRGVGKDMLGFFVVVVAIWVN